MDGRDIDPEEREIYGSDRTLLTGLADLQTGFPCTSGAASLPIAKPFQPPHSAGMDFPIDISGSKDAGELR